MLFKKSYKIFTVRCEMKGHAQNHPCHTVSLPPQNASTANHKKQSDGKGSSSPVTGSQEKGSPHPVIQLASVALPRAQGSSFQLLSGLACPICGGKALTARLRSGKRTVTQINPFSLKLHLSEF